MPNLTWDDAPPEYRPRRLTIQPSVKPGMYRFSIDAQDVSHFIDFADIVFFSRREVRPPKITVRTAVELPEEIEVVLFTGEKPNGTNR